MASENSKNTTGHVWDDDLEELNNPLPNWWIWTFYLTVIFSVVYWLLYPAWPIGQDYTKGVSGLNTITYTATTVDGQKVEKTTHWNMWSRLMAEQNVAQAAQKQWFDKVASTDFEAIAGDADLMQFVNSAGKTLFSDNCAPCHQSGGQGMVGFFPNLTDDDWLYGGTYEQIQTSINNGRNGMMPAFKGTLSDEKLTQVANFVLSLSGEPHDAVAATAGEAIFKGEGTCFACHGMDGKGVQAMGSANLADKIWLWANVPAQETAEAKAAELVKHISTGFSMQHGVMPAWSERLKPEQIKLLTVYVHDSLGGGK